MNLKNKIGNIALVFFVVLTIGIWFFLRHETLMFDSYATATHSLGQITGLVGMVLFALSFILTTRAKWVEESFGGLDKVYKSHHLVGAIAFILLLFHPLLLVIKFVPSNIKQAAIYLLPSASWPVNFGIIALLGMAVLIILTLYINMKYENWKISHRWFGIVFAIAMLHIFLVTTDITRYPFLRYYLLLICDIGGIAHIYGSYLRPSLKKNFLYAVESVKTEGKVKILELKPQHKKLSFQPGQFVFIKFHEENIKAEQHPFTIASSPLDENLRFAIKALGDFTSQLEKVKPGTLAEIEGPYGELNSHSSNQQNRVWIAGGIGVTPFISMAEHLEKSKVTPQKIHLYYCTKDKNEAVLLDKLNKIENNIKNFKVIPWFSSEKGRLSVDLIEKTSGIKNTSFSLCGPSPMMKSLTKELMKKGVQKSNIYMEDFNIK